MSLIPLPSTIKIENLLFNTLTAQSQFAYLVTSFFLLIFVIIISLIVYAIGFSHQWDMPHESLIMLDGAWRLYNGQIPHIDFPSSIGPVSLLITTLGMAVFKPSAEAIAYGPLLIFPVVILWAWYLTKSRLPAVPAILITLMIGCLLIATRPLHFWIFHNIFEIKHTSYAMLYNRFGWCFFCLMLIPICLPFQNKKTDVLGMISIGMCLTLLAFIKINYFSMALLVILLSFFIKKPSVKEWLFFSFGVFMIAAPLFVYLGFSFSAFMNDMQMLSKVNGVNIFFRLHTLMNRMMINFSELLIIFIVIFTLTSHEIRLNHKIWFTNIFVAFYLTIISLVICSTNAQIAGIPTFAIILFSLCEIYRRNYLIPSDTVNESSKLRYQFCMYLSGYLLAFLLVFDLGSIVYSYNWKLKNADTKYPDSGYFKSETLKNIILPPSIGSKYDTETMKNVIKNKPYSSVHSYVYIINDGIELLKSKVSDNSRIFSIYTLNPFPFALQLPSPKGNLIWWDPKSFNQKYHPDSLRITNDSDFIIEYKLRSQHLFDIFRQDIKQSFELIDDSVLWRLYKKKS